MAGRGEDRPPETGRSAGVSLAGRGSQRRDGVSATSKERDRSGERRKCFSRSLGGNQRPEDKTSGNDTIKLGDRRPLRSSGTCRTPTSPPQLASRTYWGQENAQSRTDVPSMASLSRPEIPRGSDAAVTLPLWELRGRHLLGVTSRVAAAESFASRGKK